MEPTSDPDTEAVLASSRAFLGLIAQSLAPTLENTRIDDFRVLVILNNRGRLSRRDLGTILGTHALTVDESLRRLSLTGQIDIHDTSAVITSRGRALVDEVTERRRRAIARLLGELNPDQRHTVVEAMRHIAEVTGEPDPEALLVLLL